MKRINKNKAMQSAGYLAVTMVVLFLSTACDKKSSSSSGGGVPAPAPQAPLSYDGGWSGQTSLGDSMSFGVSAETVNVFRSTYTVSGLYCTSRGHITINSINAAIADGKFESRASEYVVTGQFNSDASATGTFELSDDYCMGTASLTWTASKGAGAAGIASQSGSKRDVEITVLERIMN